MRAKKAARGRVLQSDALRPAIQAQIDRAGSLRAVASEAGVSHALLSRFLAGAGLRASTHARLSQWLEAQNPDRLMGLRAELARLLAPLGAREAKRIEAAILKTLSEAFAAIPR